MGLRELSKKDWAKLRHYFQLTLKRDYEIFFFIDRIEARYLSKDEERLVDTCGYFHGCMKEAFSVPFNEIAVNLDNGNAIHRAIYQFRLNTGL